MAEFEGFSEEAITILLDIRFNNNKEWYDANKDRYKQYVHEPMAEFAERVYAILHDRHEEFTDKAKICRIFRDVRFSKNKQRYKDSKWFFFREGSISTIEYPKPNYFFEIKAEKYVYGLGFWAKAKHMELFRENVRSNPSALCEMVDVYNAQNVFSLSGDMYKKKFQEDVEEPLRDWYLRKEFTFVAERSIDDILFSPAIVDRVAADFLKLYPVYDYFSQIMRNVASEDSDNRYNRS